MIELPINFEIWLSHFPDQELAGQIRRIVNDGYVQNSEELIYNCVVAYHKAQILFNLNPEKKVTLETIGSPVVGLLTDTAQPNIKTQRTTYTVSFVSKIEVTQSTVIGLEKPK